MGRVFTEAENKSMCKLCVFFASLQSWLTKAKHDVKEDKTETCMITQMYVVILKEKKKKCSKTDAQIRSHNTLTRTCFGPWNGQILTTVLRPVVQ